VQELGRGLKSPAMGAKRRQSQLISSLTSSPVIILNAYLTVCGWLNPKKLGRHFVVRQAHSAYDDQLICTHDFSWISVKYMGSIVINIKVINIKVININF
jgi:hypothetical protein